MSINSAYEKMMNEGKIEKLGPEKVKIDEEKPMELNEILQKLSSRITELEEQLKKLKR